MAKRTVPTLTVRLLEERRQELLDELRPLAPDLVRKLEETLAALQEHREERSEYDGLDRPGLIRRYLEKLGRPAELREIRNALAAPVSRFDARSIWDGGKREVEQGRLINVADEGNGKDWVLALPEWEKRDPQPRPEIDRQDHSLGGMPPETRF